VVLVITAPRHAGPLRTLLKGCGHAVVRARRREAARETVSRIRFAIGDCALEAEPMREYGGREKSEAPFHGEGAAVPAGRGHRGVVS
jgi:hypothetical protein